jgi:predicted esterase
MPKVDRKHFVVLLLLFVRLGNNQCFANEPNPVAMLADFLKFPESKLDDIADQAFATMPLTKDQTKDALRLLVSAHADQIRNTRMQEHEARRLTIDQWVMPYHVETFGDRPDKGHSLYISMHGGGGTHKRVNDGQWENQKRLYRVDEGIYVAPRAPTDTWNLWHQEHIDLFFTRLIENIIVFEAINPDRIYITGYSAGGDGVFQLAPRMADRFAAAAMMAGHPNETQALGLRNLPFTIHMGERDSAYNRNVLAGQWKEKLAELEKKDPKGYKHWVEIHKGKGHWVDRQDVAGVKWMAQFERNLVPERVVWLQDDVLHHRFYWLEVAPQHSGERQLVTMSREGSLFTIDHADPKELTILLRDDMTDLDKPIAINYHGKPLFNGAVNRTIGSMVATLLDRGDPSAVFPARVTVIIPSQTTHTRSVSTSKRE